MKLWEGIRVALAAIWAHKLRSFLVMLGNVIAVASIIAVVSIVDGMNAYMQEKVFAQFFRVESKQTRGIPGTGLGLAIARSIIDLHGGTISVSSRVGEGTTVECEIPGVLHGPSEEYTRKRAVADAVTPRPRLAPDDAPEDMQLSAG